MLQLHNGINDGRIVKIYHLLQQVIH